MEFGPFSFPFSFLSLTFSRFFYCRVLVSLSISSHWPSGLAGWTVIGQRARWWVGTRTPALLAEPCYNTQATAFHIVFISLLDYGIRRYSSMSGSTEFVQIPINDLWPR